MPINVWVKIHMKKGRLLIHKETHNILLTLHNSVLTGLTEQTKQPNTQIMQQFPAPFISGVVRMFA